MSTRFKSVFLGSLSSQVFLVISMLVNLSVIPFTISYLQKDQYGFALVIMQIFGYFLLMDFGLGSSLTRFLSRHRERNKENDQAINQIISTGFFVYLLIGLLVFIAGFLVSNYLAKDLGIGTEEGKNMILMLSVFLAFRFPLFSIEGLLFAHQKQSLNNSITFFAGLLNSLIIVISIYYGAGIYAFAYAFMCSSTSTFLVKLLYIRKYYPFIKISSGYYSNDMLKELYSFGFFTFLNFLSIQLILHSDKILISSIVSAEAVAVFAITARIPEIAMTLINKIGENSVPIFVEKASHEGNESLKESFKKLLKITTILVCIAFWLIITFNKVFIQLWVGKEFYAGEQVGLLIAVFFGLFTLQYINSICLYSMGKVRNYSLLSFVQALLNIGLSIYLGHKFGILGIIASTILSISLSLFYIPYKTICDLKLSSWEYLNEPILKPVIVLSSLGFGYYFLINNYVAYNSFTWITMIIFIGVGLLILLSASYFILLRSDIKEFIKNGNIDLKIKIR